MKKLHQIRLIMLLVILLMVATGGLFIYAVFDSKSASAEQVLGCGTVDSVAFASDVPGYTHPGRTVFDSNCAVCHSVYTDEIIVGPFLKEIFHRKESAWVRKMIRNGKQLVEQKDSYALAQYRKFDRVVHPDFDHLSQGEMETLLAYLSMATQKE